MGSGDRRSGEEATMLPGETPDKPHPHPRRHRRALRSALTVAGLGVFVFLAGLVFLITDTRNALLVSLMVIGVTLLLLSPVWYFTYMERLEPDLYAPDSPQDTKETSQEGRRR